MDAVRRGGTISLSGVYGGEGGYPMPMMTMFDKQLQLRMGQCNVKAWIDDLLPLVEDPSDPLGVMDLTTHRVPLEDAPDAYAMFQARTTTASRSCSSPEVPGPPSRVGLAARTALAATLAWLIALALPWEIAQTYPYFAPLGAVVGSYSTVRSSVRNSARAVAAIVCGALVSLVVAELLGRDLLVVPLVVFLATLLAGWRLFADQGSWVLTVGLFVLVVGVQHPVQYAVGYTVLTLLGAAWPWR